MQAEIRQESDGWLLRVDGDIRGLFKAWNADDAKTEAARRLGVMVEWEPRGDLEYVAVIVNDDGADWR
jgi:hypothetical protein